MYTHSAIRNRRFTFNNDTLIRYRSKSTLTRCQSELHVLALIIYLCLPVYIHAYINGANFLMPLAIWPFGCVNCKVSGCCMKYAFQFKVFINFVCQTIFRRALTALFNGAIGRAPRHRSTRSCCSSFAVHCLLPVGGPGRFTWRPLVVSWRGRGIDDSHTNLSRSHPFYRVMPRSFLDISAKYAALVHTVPRGPRDGREMSLLYSNNCICRVLCPPRCAALSNDFSLATGFGLFASDTCIR
jgi:hypothetical protein